MSAEYSHENVPTGVLIIEDSQVQAKIIGKQIQALTNFSTIWASSMEEARTLLESRRDEMFAAVVDLNLPDAPDGEAVDLVLGSSLPSIVLTATFNENIRQQFFEKKVADYFFKGTVRDMDPMVSSLERIWKNRFVNVLVVDDSKAQCHFMRHLLEVQNFHVIMAHDGVQAVEALAANPDIRLIITDYEMPEMDGLELTRQVRERHKMDKVAIVGVSTLGSGALSALFLKNGANDFLTKPFEVEEFYWRANQTVEMLDVISELKDCTE